MQFRHSLRFRILFSYLIFGMGIGGLLAFAHYYSLSELEEILVYEHVEDEMNYFIELTDNNNSVSKLRTKKFAAFKVKQDKSIDEYPFLRDLSIGRHVIEVNEYTYTIVKKIINNFAYYVIYDETDFEDREKFYLITIYFSLALVILLSLWFGYWISGKILSPVARLANQVENLHTSKLNIPISKEYADDEVGKLASTFEEFMKKLIHYVERERSFTADASHELRTPLSVIQGAVEIMLASDNLSEQDVMRVERIERATRDMSQNLTALLTLAREPSSNDFEGQADLSQVINDVVESNQESFSNKPIQLILNLKERVVVDAPANIVSVLVSNLIRNSFLYTNEGEVCVQLDDHKLIISDTGVGIAAEELQKIFEKGYRASNTQANGSGLGLSLSKRICDYYGWKLTIESSKGNGTTVTWSF